LFILYGLNLRKIGLNNIGIRPFIELLAICLAIEMRH